MSTNKNKNATTKTDNTDPADLVAADAISTLEKMGMASTIIEKADAIDPDEMVGEGFSADITHSLKAGQKVTGVFLGRGGDILINDPKRGPEPIPVPTFRIGRPGMTVSLLGSAQLVTKLSPLPLGTYVCILHTGQTDTRGGQRVNTYQVWTKNADATSAALAGVPFNGPGAVPALPAAHVQPNGSTAAPAQA